MHAFGQPADMDPTRRGRRAARASRVIEDACEAIGASYKGRPVGHARRRGVFAFYPNKQMTTGEGGMIVTDDAEWADLFRSLRNQGRDVVRRVAEPHPAGLQLPARRAERGAGPRSRSPGSTSCSPSARGSPAWYNERLDGVERLEVPHDCRRRPRA